jgi:hypothetical protein
MDWIRLDVDVLTDPKVMGTGWEGAILYLWGLTYAGKHETDGLIPEPALEAVPRWLKRPAVIATNLVAAGLWETAKDGWKIHNFTKRQPTKAELDARRKAEDDRRRAEADRKARWRERRQSHGTDPGTSGETDPGTSPVMSHGTDPGSHALDTKTVRDSTGQDPEVLGSVIDGLVSPEGGSGGKPDLEDPITIPDGLTDIQAHCWERICRSNRVFKGTWPGTFHDLKLTYGVGALTDALQAMAVGDLSTVTHPRAYLIETVKDHATKRGETASQTTPEPEAKSAGK